MARDSCIIGLMTLFLILAGCAGHISQDNTTTPTPISFTQTPTQAPIFPRNPIDLHGRLQVPVALGSFEESYIGTYQCTNETETYETNYLFVSGLNGSHRIHLELVPVDNEEDLNEIPMPKEVLNAGIAPGDFIAEPNHLYTIRAGVTVGPNVTGESHETPGGGGWARNPYFPFLLRTFVDGAPAPDGNDRLTVIKWCHYFGQTREMQPEPSIDVGMNKVTMHPGEARGVNITFWNYGGGIRELGIRILGQLIAPGYWHFPLISDDLKPFPKNMTVTFDPPISIGRNFRNDNVTMVVTTGQAMPAGQYDFPLELCYRILDTADPSAPHFPFSEHLICPTAGEFVVQVEK